MEDVKCPVSERRGPRLGGKIRTDIEIPYGYSARTRIGRSRGSRQSVSPFSRLSPPPLVAGGGVSSFRASRRLRASPPDGVDVGRNEWNEV
jgi:hypothetical protein